MLWNDLTTDMLIMVYIAGLFVLILVCMYALIQSKANKLYTFIIIPLALLMASMTWQGIKMLQGMPIYGLPWEEKIEVLYVQDTKPWIFVLVKEEDGPKLYKIDWTEENKKKMKEIQKQIGSSNAQGQFKLKGNKGESQSLFFLPMGDASEPDEKGRQDEGVTFTTTRSTPSAYVDGQGLQLDVHDGGVEFVREHITEVP